MSVSRWDVTADYPSTSRAFFDKCVSSLSSVFIWGCPTYPTLVGHFNKNTLASQRLLVIGPDKGYYFDHAKLTRGASVVLLDIDQANLDIAQKRLHASHEVGSFTVNVDIFEPADLMQDRLGVKFDTISLMHVLHCLSGDCQDKLYIIRKLSTLLTKNGTLFGTTILGRGSKYNPISKGLIQFYNKKGMFSNQTDKAGPIIRTLQARFHCVEWRIKGAVLIFRASKPK